MYKLQDHLWSIPEMGRIPLHCGNPYNCPACKYIRGWPLNEAIRHTLLIALQLSSISQRLSNHATAIKRELADNND